jgi:hypothetical protein
VLLAATDPLSGYADIAVVEATPCQLPVRARDAAGNASAHLHAHHQFRISPPVHREKETKNGDSFVHAI